MTQKHNAVSEPELFGSVVIGLGAVVMRIGLHAAEPPAFEQLQPQCKAGIKTNSAIRHSCHSNTGRTQGK